MALGRALASVVNVMGLQDSRIRVSIETEKVDFQTWPSLSCQTSVLKCQGRTVCVLVCIQKDVDAIILVVAVALSVKYVCTR